MVANSTTNPIAEIWSWEACSPSGLATCTPFGTGRILDTADAAAETVFRISSNYGATALSPLWHGKLVSIVPPSVRGTVRANQLVTPVPGEWSGGWEGDSDWTQLSACSTRSGTNCMTLTDRGYAEEHAEACPNGAAVIDPAFTGDYLRVADFQVGPRPVVAGVGTSSPYGHQVWVANPTVSVSVVGPIAPAVRARSVDCGPPPLIEASISAQGAATVKCGLGCRAVLIARRGKLRARLVRKLDPYSSLPSQDHPVPVLSLPPESLARLGPGRTRMIVKVDGRRMARRTVLLR